ncbi:MAG: response regulator [Anaerolineales bacterium]|jgi:two-component system cell cycle response regulator DivK
MDGIGINGNGKKNGKAKRVLLAEDEEHTIDVLLDIFEAFFERSDVRVARDGHEAVNMAFDLKPDVILMDLGLPKLDGWKATRSIKSHADFLNIPILAITAYAMVGDRERAMEAGCDDYFAKPIEVDKFIQFMRPYLNSGG